MKQHFFLQNVMQSNTEKYNLECPKVSKFFIKRNTKHKQHKHNTTKHKYKSVFLTHRV